MKNTNIIIVMIIALVIGGGAGYFLGINAADNGAKTKELQDSIAMMNDQAASIQEMAEMMRSRGVTMRELGTKYKDDAAVSYGKDLETLGEKYMTDIMNASKAHGSMKQMSM